METNLTRTERTIAITAVAAISIFFAMFLKVNNRTQSNSEFESATAIDYKMARPEQAYSEYTLDGREIDETYEGLPVKEVKNSKLDKKKQELIAKQNAENKKKEELKKKQAQAAKTQAQQQAAAKQAALSKAPVSGDKSRNSDESDSVQADSGYTSAPYNNTNAAVAKKEDKKDDSADPKKDKKDFAAWRTLLFATPTPENLALFLAAFRANEVTSEEYFAMAQDLVDQTDAKLKGLGLMALRSVPSLKSLSQLAHLGAASVGNYQSYVDQSLLAYLNPQNIGYLSQALATKDKVLVVKTLTLLNVNLTKFSQGDLGGLGDPRNGRNGEVTTFTMASYRSLVPALAQLLTSQDQQLATLAQQVTTIIQSSNNIALN